MDAVSILIVMLVIYGAITFTRFNKPDIFQLITGNPGVHFLSLVSLISLAIIGGLFFRSPFKGLFLSWFSWGLHESFWYVSIFVTAIYNPSVLNWFTITGYGYILDVTLIIPAFIYIYYPRKLPSGVMESGTLRLKMLWLMIPVTIAEIISDYYTQTGTVASQTFYNTSMQFGILDVSTWVSCCGIAFLFAYKFKSKDKPS